MFISAVGILLTFCLSTVIFYELFKSEVVDELKTYADVIKETQSYDQILQGEYDPDVDDLRITMIKKDGKVFVHYSGQILRRDRNWMTIILVRSVRESQHL